MQSICQKFLLSIMLKMLNNNTHGEGCIADLEKIIIDPSDAMFLPARSGFLVFLVKKLFHNTRCFFHPKEKDRSSMIIIQRSLSLKKNRVLHLSIRLEQIVSILIGIIKNLYETDAVQFDTLQGVLNPILESFLSRRDISLIDQFAILNSLRKGFGFYHNLKYWEVSFGLKSNFSLSRSKVVLTLDSSIFFQKFRLIMRQLEPIPMQHDLLCFMYRTILRDPEHMVVPTIPISFELTVQQNYRFWLRCFNWETRRDEFLKKCLCKFVSRAFFSKKDMNYFFPRTNIGSFQDFFKHSHIAYHSAFKEKISGLSFEPI
jgi:hypothetical protein